MAFDWADEVNESIEKGELPDFASKNDIPKDSTTQQEMTKDKATPESVRSIQKSETIVERDPDWYNKKSWRAKEMPGPANLPRSILDTTEVAKSCLKTPDNGRNDGMNMVKTSSSVESPASSEDTFVTASQGSTGSTDTFVTASEGYTPVITKPLLISGTDSVKQKDNPSSKPISNSQRKAHTIGIDSSNSNVDGIRQKLERSSTPEGKLQFDHQSPASETSEVDERCYHPARDGESDQCFRREVEKRSTLPSRESDGEITEENFEKKVRRTLIQSRERQRLERERNQALERQRSQRESNQLLERERAEHVGENKNEDFAKRIGSELRQSLERQRAEFDRGNAMKIR